MQAIIKLDNDKAIFQRVRKVVIPDSDVKATGYVMGNPYRRVYCEGARYWCIYKGKRRDLYLVE